MDENEIDRELLIRTFVVEAGDTLSGMEQRLVELEGRPEDEELIHELFRAAHTIKGSATLVGFDGVGEVAHHVEGLLARMRARTLRATDAVVTLLLRSVDEVRTCMAEAVEGRTGLTADTKAFCDLMRRAAEGVAPEPLPEPGRGDGHEDAPGQTRAAGRDGAVATTSARTMRVEVSRLDQMLELSGEISIARGRIADMLERLGGAAAEAILEAHRQADQLHFNLQDLVMRSRMVSLGPVFQALQRVTRDVAAAEGKQVRLLVEDGDVEVDTAVVERIRDPLMHMVRNAVGHGIEAPALRQGLGKDPCGSVMLRASRDAGSMVIQVSDDGAGVDPARLLRRAEELGMVSKGTTLDEEAARRLVFEPGFSTSEQVTEVSGRGVGMDVVRRSVEALRGSVDIESTVGLGTTVTLRLPLTLAIIQGFRVRVGDEVYVLPMDAVLECFELPARPEGSRSPGVFDLRGVALPLLDLREHFGLPSVAASQRCYSVVVQNGHLEVGLVVDEILGEAQTVLKTLGRLLGEVAGVSGSAILGDGRVALVLDVGRLLAEALRRAPQGGRVESP